MFPEWFQLVSHDIDVLTLAKVIVTTVLLVFSLYLFYLFSNASANMVDNGIFNQYPFNSGRKYFHSAVVTSRDFG